MRTPQRLSAWLFGLTVIAPAVSAAEETIDRELHVIVEVEASQEWESRTDEYGHQHSEATTTQRYELRTQLRSDTGLHTRNLLDPDKEERLKAKTIHLARQAVEAIEASGDDVRIPRTPEERAQMTQRMQEQMTECGTDAKCRNDLNQRYAAIFAAAENPDMLDADADEGDRRYRYFESFDGCTSDSHVRMRYAAEGVHYSEGENELVPFTEKRSAEATNPELEVPLCSRYLAVIDTGDEDKPLYLENFYVPPAEGETVIEEAGATRRTTEDQPMPPGALAWVTQQLKHAPKSGAVSGEYPLKFALNGVSRQTGSSSGTAEVELRWAFGPPGETEAPQP